MDCGQPGSADDNGDVIVDTTTFESTASYTCDEGYILTGSDSVICQADATWSDTAPECVRKLKNYYYPFTAGIISKALLRMSMKYNHKLNFYIAILLVIHIHYRFYF